MKELILEAARRYGGTVESLTIDDGEARLVIVQNDAEIVNNILEYVQEEGFDGEVVDNYTLEIWPN